MKKAKVIGLLGALLASVLVAASSVYAERGKGHGDCLGGQHHMMHHFEGDSYIESMAQRLDLNDEQLTRIRAIVDEKRPQMRELKDTLNAGRKQLHALVDEGTASDDEVRPIAEAQGATMAELIVLRMTMKSDIHQVLTEEQRTQLEQMRAKHGRRG